MTAADQDRIAEAVRVAETGTRAELVCVLARSASNYEFFPLVWAALIALALPWALVVLTSWSVERIVVAQLATFLVGLLALSWAPIRMALVPRAIRRKRAHRAAAEQFLIRGLSRTRERTGVLIFVSEAERYARVIADVGVASRVADARWTEAIELLVGHARAGRVADGFVEAVSRCGSILADVLPPEGPPHNELGDRLTVI